MQTASEFSDALVPVNASFSRMDRFTSSACYFAPAVIQRDSLGLQTYIFALEEDLAKAQEYINHMGKASDGTSAKQDEILQAAARQVSTPWGTLDVPYSAMVYPRVP